MDEQSNTQIEPFCVILTNFWAKKNFSKKFGSVNVILRKMLRLLAKNKLSHLGTFSFSPSVLSTYNPTISYKISEKKLIWDHFGLFSDKQEFSQKTWLP